jgi:integrase
MIEVKFSNSRKKNGHSPWVVEINIGKRKRKYFPTREKAYAYRKEVLQPFQDGTDEDSPVEQIRVSTVFKKHIDRLIKRGARPETITSRRMKCSTFIKRMNDPRLSEVTRQNFKEYILQYGQTEKTRLSIRSEVGAFLNWAFEHDYTTTNYYKVTWDAYLEDEKLIGILTPQEAKDLMYAIPDGYKVAMALCLFAGIRPYEIPRIRWDNIYTDKKLIIIEGTQAKTRRNRKLTDLPDNLMRWIEVWKPKAMGDKGPINTYRVFAKKRKQACRDVGILYPHDGARHSFGTYGYFVGGKPWAMRCMGHNNQTTYDQYYLNTGVGADEATEYFRIQ